ncbi:uncharacterized protein LOC131880399 [Tigriopus californicus]|uniref:uncharacterized protein LOC131880399 n=1 Tax=Tigriopus californicus TaxID=6832 RepID=UPI0027D9EB01|nr:uncharacterized protein LOC131880399 [Tigriopus californicus]
MAYLMADMSNDVYDHHPDTYDLVGKDRELGPYTLILGVFVTLIPRLIPRILPRFIKNDEVRERFDDEVYMKDIEEQFRQRFLENLGIFETLVSTWRDNGLDLSQFGINLGPDKASAKDDLVAGNPENFQNDLLRGIHFLQSRVSNHARKDDRIAQIAETVWGVFTTTYRTVTNYLESTTA